MVTVLPTDGVLLQRAGTFRVHYGRVAKPHMSNKVVIIFLQASCLQETTIFGCIFVAIQSPRPLMLQTTAAASEGPDRKPIVWTASGPAKWQEALNLSTPEQSSHHGRHSDYRRWPSQSPI
jgi:hypothetical protein